ncbi:DNA topoisomerase III [Enterocloster lavalensis]|uniref:DNA topoisomerase III n=1 Tax=Enterocloster lavalensis TaxID=460384 RepID=UPI001DCFB210|nr:DNA topoisomerase III [Enterocloster lavalensis]MBS5604535.1 DNA topoisomerase III [Enterocloster asparagiformis]
MKSLVIAEKPSVARDIARVLKCGRQINGAIEGGAYIVTWGLGHLVELADPEAYDPKYKEWKMEDLPMMPEPFKLEVIRQTTKQYQAVKAQIHRKDVGEIIIATDAGREGELVARLILKKAGSQKPLKRLWISSVTDKAIREGFANLKDGRDYENLYDAAMCRAEADWLVGINATRALTCKYNAQLSCGRVQTPTLAMIAKREEEIRRFVPQPYYGIQAKCASPALTLTWQDGETKNFRSFDRARMEQMLKALQGTAAGNGAAGGGGAAGRTGVVAEIKRTPKKTQAPLLYDLTELQRDANKRFNYSAKETLNIMQRLYENHKVLTYPRTDSRYLSADIVPTLKERLKACGVGPYKLAAGRLVARPLPEKLFFVDNSKVSDHHAIIPTEQFVQLDHMTVDERRIYDLVVRRFLAVLYPPYEYEQTNLTVKAGGERFVAHGNIVRSQGWKAAYEDGYDGDEEEDQEVKGQRLPDLKTGDVLSRLTFVLTEGKTKPPAHFNEATLLSAMENPAAYMESGDKEMARTLGETGGLGTVATRADIIEKLFSSFLLEKRGKDILLTSKAKQLLELVPEDLKKPELTADWEMKLSKISKGALKRAVFMSDIRSYSRELIGQIKSGGGQFRHDNLTNTKCPVCGKKMLLVKGKNSEMLVCQDRECGHRETISRTSNARCPVCHKKMELKGKGDGQVFVCKCGYKEKLKAFQERRKKEGAGVTKRDVAKYLNQQSKETEEPLNDALARMLAGIKLDQ